MQNIFRFNNKSPKLGKKVYTSHFATIIGDVTIGDDCSIWPMAVIRGDMHKITIGNKTNVQDNSVLHITHSSEYNPEGYALNIGNEVTIGHSVVLHGCTIKDQCLIGIGARILDGAILDKNVMLAAGSLVPPGRKLDSGFLYIGSPAKQARKLSSKEMNFFSYTAANYVKLKNQYLNNK